MLGHTSKSVTDPADCKTYDVTLVITNGNSLQTTKHTTVQASSGSGSASITLSSPSDGMMTINWSGFDVTTQLTGHMPTHIYFEDVESNPDNNGSILSFNVPAAASGSITVATAAGDLTIHGQTEVIDLYNVISVSNGSFQATSNTQTIAAATSPIFTVSQDPARGVTTFFAAGLDTITSAVALRINSSNWPIGHATQIATGGNGAGNTQLSWLPSGSNTITLIPTDTDNNDLTPLASLTVVVSYPGDIPTFTADVSVAGQITYSWSNVTVGTYTDLVIEPSDIDPGSQGTVRNIPIDARVAATSSGSVTIVSLEGATMSDMYVATAGDATQSQFLGRRFATITAPTYVAHTPSFGNVAALLYISPYLFRQEFIAETSNTLGKLYLPIEIGPVAFGDIQVRVLSSDEGTVLATLSHPVVLNSNNNMEFDFTSAAIAVTTGDHLWFELSNINSSNPDGNDISVPSLNSGPPDYEGSVYAGASKTNTGVGGEFVDARMDLVFEFRAA